jgi:hypothetical protein
MGNRPPFLRANSVSSFLRRVATLLANGFNCIRIHYDDLNNCRDRSPGEG